MGELPLPPCRQAESQSRLAWESVPVPADLKPEALQEFRLPAAIGLASSQGGKFSLRLNGNVVLDFNVAHLDQAWHSADGKVRMSYMVMEDNSQESNGIITI